MQALLLSREAVAAQGEELYHERIRQQVETPENIGKMVIIDIETGDYAVDPVGITSAEQLHAKRPFGRLYGIRIGYRTAAVLGGKMERTAP